MDISISYWAQVYSQDDSLVPVFFFHPTLDFLSFLHQRGHSNVPIEVRGTNGLYDGRYFVTIDNPTRMGSCPSDYNHQKPLLAAFLNTPFTLYPISNGSFSLSS